MPLVRSLVSITTSARSRSGASSSRSARIPSTILPFGGERMAPARLLVAVEQRLLVGLEEEQLRTAGRRRRARRAPGSGRRSSRRRARRRRPRRARRRCPRGGTARRGADHPRRQVVDAEVAAVLEGGDRFRLARAGVAGDHHQATTSRAPLAIVSRSCAAARGFRGPPCRERRAPPPAPRGSPPRNAPGCRNAAAGRACGPARRPRSSSSTEPVIARSRRPRWCSIAKRCASSRTRCSSREASESAGRSSGARAPRHVDLLLALGQRDDGGRRARRAGAGRASRRRAGPCRRRSRPARAARRSSRRACRRAARGRPAPGSGSRAAPVPLRAAKSSCLGPARGGRGRVRPSISDSLAAPGS